MLTHVQSSKSSWDQKITKFDQHRRERFSFHQQPSFYDKSYFESGIKSQKSLYENYRWLPKLTRPLAKAICRFANISDKDIVVDYGCARGYVVRALVENGMNAFGMDISEYAIENSDALIRKRLHLIQEDTLPVSFQKMGLPEVNWIIAKDVFEHIAPEKLFKTLCEASELGIKLYVLVPLGDSGKYRIPDYELDASHVIAEDEQWWSNMFTSANFKITNFRHHVDGIKEAALNLHEKGNAQFLLQPEAKQ